MLDKYEIMEELFAVGPSTFYRARNRILGNELMVRRLSIDPSRTENVHETFYREQRHSAALSHPHIQVPLDVFEADGFLWSVHEFHTTRPTLEVIQDDGPMPIAEAARIGAQVADALAFMHSRHFVHGRVAPRFVVMDERSDATLINLVKSADLAAGIWPLRPAVLGLTPFSAPEEFQGERPTFQSDLYGLAGTIVFWMTARWPRGAANYEDALQRAADGAPIIHIQGIRPEVPPALAKALNAALNAAPDERHGSVSALGSLLSEIHQRQAAEIPSGFGTGALLAPIGRTTSVEIVSRHGAGAFGVVLRAKEPDGDRVLAVKALKPEHRDDSEAYERFLREARALQMIDHPNVVRIFGVGEENGTPYAVMEFIEGPDLATLLLREGSLPTERASKIGAGIARGLEAIHREQIIHRDMKPHNILIADGDRPVVADFGVARNAAATRLTMTGNVLGTPAYMAPEQFEDAPVSHTVDLFALGSILFEMVAGYSPFPATDALDMIRAVRDRPAEPLPDDVDPRFAAVIEGLLRKDPTERPQNAGDVARELELLMA